MKNPTLKEHLRNILPVLGVIAAIMAVVLMSSTFNGCGSTTNIPAVLSPNAKAVFYLDQYNDLAENYKTQAEMPNLTVGEITALQQRKAILLQLDPLVEQYNTIVKYGGYDLKIEKQIVELMAKISTITSGRVR